MNENIEKMIFQPTKQKQEYFEFEENEAFVKIVYHTKHITIDVAKEITSVEVNYNVLNKIKIVVDDVNNNWYDGIFKVDNTNGNSLLHISKNILIDKFNKETLENVLDVSLSNLECIGLKIMFELNQKECRNA